MIPQFNAYAVTGDINLIQKNRNFDLAQGNEANTYNNVYLDYCYQYGTDTIYIERTVNVEEPVFGEYLASKLSRGIPLRLFVEETEGWGGMGDTYSKFGIKVEDECSLFCPKLLLQQAASGFFPKYGDLIYIVKSKKLFEIKHIEDEIPPTFYLLGNRSGYLFQCKTYTYDHTEIGTDMSIPIEIQALDRVILNPAVSADWDIQSKEINKNNVPIDNYTSSNSLIDTSEQDPLLG